MKIKYKIVWLDDQPKSMRKYIDEIESFLKENYFIPDTQEAYVSYEDFQKSFETSDTNDVYGKVFNDCDLLLIDYNIAEKQENEQKTGATIIKQLRARGIYTEAVFYSNAMDDYRKMTNKDDLDNVIYADKNELISKVKYIVKKTVVQSIIISNLRGYLMDCTSDFDYICRLVSEYYFKKLTKEQQVTVLLKGEEYIHSQFKSENDKFKKINKKYINSVKYDGLSETFSFNEITDESKRIILLQKILSSMESVIVVKDKFRLMALILQLNNVEDYINIYSDIEKIEDNKDKYYNAIIKHRNSLAHNKLIYGKNCKSRIKIIKTIEDLSCNCNVERCEKSYSYEDCKELRKNIFEYYILFNQLSEPIIKETIKNA